MSPWRRAWAVGQGSLGGNFPSSRDSTAEPNFCNCMIDPQEHVVDPGNLWWILGTCDGSQEPVMDPGNL